MHFHTFSFIFAFKGSHFIQPVMFAILFYKLRSVHLWSPVSEPRMLCVFVFTEFNSIVVFHLAVCVSRHKKPGILHRVDNRIGILRRGRRHLVAETDRLSLSVMCQCMDLSRRIGSEKRRSTVTTFFVVTALILILKT